MVVVMVVTMANAAVVGKEETHKHMRLSSDVTERSRCCVSPSIHLHRMRSSRTMSSIAALLKRKEKGKKNNTAAKPRKESACVARALGFSLGGGGEVAVARGRRTHTRSWSFDVASTCSSFFKTAGFPE